MKECQICKRCYPDEVNTCPDDGMPTAQTLSGEPLLEGKYQLEKRLGQGGMGVVYKARHTYLKTAHAIKVILPDLVGNDPQLVTRFRQEALAAAAIRHNNVVGVSDYGVVAGKMPFLVMEYVEGESLHDLLTREGKLSPEKALDLMAAICAGVGAAHHQGIVHRDLKPLNVMICTGKKSMSEAVKILDFGLAKIKSGELLGSFIQAQTTGLMGSPYYMAPEQWADEEPDVRADIYSLGVILFQMLTGDVPFKGSSIPAIMKKHLSDAPPSFAESNTKIAPQIEYAVRHTLEKSRETRTQSVEQLVEELTKAVQSASQNISSIGYSTNSSLPVSLLRILTNPPQSHVFVDNISVGQTQPDGWLLLEGVQSGNHRIRITHNGYQDWESDVICDGKPQQVAIKLTEGTGGIPRPMETMPVMQDSQQHISQVSQPQMQQSYSVTPLNSQPQMQNTGQQQNWQTGGQGGYVQSQEVKKSAVSPLILAVIGIAGLFILISGGLFGAYKLGMFSGNTGGGNTNNNPPNNSSANSNSQTPPPVKAEMVKIPGGKFTMGRNGDLFESPEHEVEVKDFSIDKNEVTNAEYYEFVKAKNYNPIPSHWENGKPLTNEMNMPVRYVNIEDIKAFASWRSERDKVTYRLPTEEEWEYAARNGSDDNLYPWGDKWEEDKAVVRRDLILSPVGSIPGGANKWGVLDLVGNVWEWTETKASAYKGANPEFAKKLEDSLGKDNVVVRGTFSLTKDASTATSTIRSFNQVSKRDKIIGFRLARSD
ncbi:MAG TPA: bifunctional serine/threonine-protein kinase/formylglycine-generating enzyme family protein [Pyrinomonadaceae bacterium]|nr:bifunctional serine/threonine-protein kinase/formylglycine-generating enzyme family protein [Pyrinomonadaceae bacterium]